MNGVLPRTTPEQRAPLYEDVETLLTTGFLSQPVTVNGTRLALRTLNSGDIFLLQARSFGGVEADWRAWFIAASVWMVNGTVVLGEVNAPTAVYPAIRGLSRSALDKLFSISMTLFDRHNKANKAIEPYSYETESRISWSSYGRHLPSSHAGIPGVEAIGTNSVQRIWTFINEVDDQRVKDTTMWEGFKLSVSAQSSKGIKKLDQHDQNVRKQEADRRQMVQDRFYYTQMGFLLPDGTTPDGLSYGMRTKTVEDLEKEMKDWVTGQQDWHDRVVNEYKTRVTAQYDKEKQDRAARLAAVRAQQEAEGLLDQPARMVVYSAEQLEEHLRGRRAGPGGVKQIIEGPNPRDYLYSKFLEAPPDSGLLQVVDGKLLAANGGADLTETLASRTVPFRTEEGEG